MNEGGCSKGDACGCKPKAASKPAADAPTGVDRRQFLGAAAVGGMIGQDPAGPRRELFLAEEHWRERMQAPADGKRYGWVVDVRRCFGCHGCEVACKAENDVPLGHYMRQTIYHDHQTMGDHRNGGGGLARIMVPIACQHCEDAPCIKACPCGALHKAAGGSVQVDYDACSGHGACKEACPYGAIYIDPVANQAVKCHNCTHRVEVGMEPACVSTCPSEALYFGDLDDPDAKVSKMKAKLEQEGLLAQLRPEKGTQPRMWFASSADRPMAAWEPKVPKEGESYRNDAYSVYEWKQGGAE